MKISGIIDICDYVKAVCTADATIIVIALNENGDPMTVRDVVRLIARETKGEIILGDQSIRNALEKLEKLKVVNSKKERWGKKRTKTKYSLSIKGKQIIEALKAFVEEIKKQVASHS